MSAARPSEGAQLPPGGTARSAKDAPASAARLSLARASLLLLWWGTVAASLHDGGAAGMALLQKATGMGAGLALALVLLGSAWDAAIGLLILLRPGAPTYRLAAAGVIGMTLLATALLPSLWLDPFGALLKNLPVLALLALLEPEASRA